MTRILAGSPRSWSATTRPGTRSSPSTDLAADLNVDSVAAMDLIMEIEDRFEIDIPINLVSDMTTVADLVALVDRQIKAREARLMDIFDKYAQYAQRHEQLLAHGRRPVRRAAGRAAFGDRGRDRRPPHHPRRHQQLSRPDLRSRLHRRRRGRAARATAPAPPARASPTAPTGSTRELEAEFARFLRQALVHGVQHRLPGQSRHDRRARQPARRRPDRRRLPRQHLRCLQAVGRDGRPLPAQRRQRPRQAPDPARAPRASASW